MKKIIRFSAVAAVLAMTVSCAKEKVVTPVEPVESEDAVFYISASAPESKAYLGEDGITILWNDGDQIKVNNHNSIKLPADDNHGTTADFGFKEGDTPGDAPYYGVYNASRAYGYGEVGGEHTYKLSLDYNNYTQTWYEDSFDPQFCVLYGKGETTSIQFHHAMAYIKVTPTRGTEDVNIAKVMIFAKGGEVLSGRMIIDTESGALTAYRDTRDYVTMAGPADGVELGKPFMIAIPAGTYEQGLKFRFVDVNGNMMEQSTKTFTAQAGVVYTISAVYENPVACPAVATAAEVTSSTACFTWTMGGTAAEDAAKAYTIQCSASADFADATEYTIPTGSASSVWDNKTPKFCFGGLNQNTKYYFRVKNGADAAWSDTVSATTATYDKTVVSTDANVGDVILAEDFAASAVQAEISAMAAGVSETGTSFTKCTGSFTVANNSVSYLPDALKNWGFARRSGGANLYANQGHIKLGTGSAQSYLVTPELSAIPAGNKATVEVTLTVAVYPDSNNDLKNVKQAIVSVEKGELNASNNLFTLSTTALAHSTTFDLAADNSKWTTYTVRLSNVENTDHIMIGSPVDAGNHRLLVNDVKVKVVAYDVNKVSDISLVYADRTSATIRWENIAGKIGTASTYCFNVYEDEACTQPVYNQDVITFDVPFSCYSPFGTSKYIGQKSGSAIAATELKAACGLLQPDKDYWFRVKPISESIAVDNAKTKTGGTGQATFSNSAAGAAWSDPFHFKTAAEHVAATNEVIYTGFDALCIGPNLERMTAGTAPTFDWEAGLKATADAKPERMAFLSSFNAGTYSYGWCTWAPDRCNVAQGSYFGAVVAWWGFTVDDSNYKYLDGTNTNFKLNGSTARYNRLGAVGDVKDWYLTSQVFPHMGMAFMNDTGNYIGTPNLTTNLSATPATCTVRVKAAKVSNNGNTTDLTIKAYKYSKTENKLNTTEVATITIPGKSCYKSYTDATNYMTDFTTKDYTCEVSLASGDAIVLAVSSFAIIDEIQIIKK